MWNIVKISCLLWHYECMMEDIKSLIGLFIVVPIIIGLGVPIAITVATALAGGFTYLFYLAASFFLSWGYRKWTSQYFFWRHRYILENSLSYLLYWVCSWFYLALSLLLLFGIRFFLVDSSWIECYCKPMKNFSSAFFWLFSYVCLFFVGLPFLIFLVLGSVVIPFVIVWEALKAIFGGWIRLTLLGSLI